MVGTSANTSDRIIAPLQLHTRFRPGIPPCGALFSRSGILSEIEAGVHSDAFGAAAVAHDVVLRAGGAIVGRVVAGGVANGADHIFEVLLLVGGFCTGGLGSPVLCPYLIYRIFSERLRSVQSQSQLEDLAAPVRRKLSRFPIHPVITVTQIEVVR